MKRTLIYLLMIVLLVATVEGIKADILVSQGDTFDYATVPVDLWSNWSSAGYSSFDWQNATWTPGTAPFGNVGQPTSWSANTDLALTKTINVNGTVSNATLYAGVDNGFIFFINGAEVARQNEEGGWGYWEYSIPVAGTFLHPGNNTVQVILEDHGGLTGFDMMLTADVLPVPEPATLLLLGTGLFGLAEYGKRKFQKLSSV